MNITIGSDVLHDFQAASSREWLVTNGQGGYASGSLSGANTRRYHGHLVAAVTPPTVRRVLLSQLEAAVTIGGQTYELAANQYRGTVHPEGYRYLERFEAWPAPTFRYAPSAGVVIEKTVWMAYGRNTTYVRYTLVEGRDAVSLRLSPLVCDKSYHAEMTASDRYPVNRFFTPLSLAVQSNEGSPNLVLKVDGAKFETAGYWHYGLQHDRERERGWPEFQEDLYCPSHFVATLEPGKSVTLVATIEDEISPPDVAWSGLLDRQNDLRKRARPANSFEDALVLAADAYVIEGEGLASPDKPYSKRKSAADPGRRAPRSTVIAGYHWFTDWGRDTMISLPGLCLATGRPEVARDILLSYCRHVSEGMIPNRFPDRGLEPEYNTVDASLWFIQAGWEYLRAVPDDEELLDTLWPAWQQIVEYHIAGTRYHIQVDPDDGLIEAGEPGVQLTWMDAKVGDWVVTPRIGKPVEVNALWYNALRIIASFGERQGDDVRKLIDLAEKVRNRFCAGFLRSDGRGLYDVLTDSGPDVSIRPNQILAVSLPFPALEPAHQREVVQVIEEELLTPFGLRSLSPADSSYRPHYAGDPVQRDGAYHQGTVWAWLLGPFVEAHLRVYGDKEKARSFLEPLRRHLLDAGIGQISEIFDGDEPHLPNGCVAQAWSVAEVLRTLKLLN